jgi:hypothetical protein
MTMIYEHESCMTPDERTDYVIARTKDAAFDAVCDLWRKRQSSGMTQSDLASAMDADEGWVSRNLRGPGNWTIRTMARFVAGLNGEVEIIIHDLTDAKHDFSNFDAYSHLHNGNAKTSSTSLFFKTVAASSHR